MLRQVAAFSPGHLTGLFYMQDASSDALLAGSLGAGFSILKGVTTIIEVKKSFEECSVTLNDAPNDAPVSHLVRDLFFKELGEKPIPIEVSCGDKDKSQIKRAIKKYNSSHGIIISNTTPNIVKNDNIICIPPEIFAFI